MPPPTRSFGLNHNGQLGNGAKDEGTAIPYKVAEDVIGVWDEGDSSMYLGADGRLYVFGYGPWPQIGDKEGIYMPKIATPLSFPLFHDGQELVIRNAALGTAFASILAIDTQNRLWAFGMDFEGSLGLGYDPGAVDIRAAEYHSLVLKNDGSLWFFGLNAFGQSGEDPQKVPYHSTPFKIATGVTAITADSRYSVFARENVIVAFGELPFDDGEGGLSIKVPGEAAELEAGPFHFVFSVGDAWWGGGTNDSGQLRGLPDRSSPASLGVFTDT